MRLVVINHVSLDGVLQGPGRPGEDERDGFEHSGWARRAADDPALGETIGERMGDDFSWLLGRRSYEDMLEHWNAVGGPFKDGLNLVDKYVATSNPQLELRWPNSRRLTGDVPTEVGRLRGADGGNLVVMGSGQLIRSLLPHALVDEMVLMIHPVVLGSGRRLFGESASALPLRLVDSTVTSSGVVVATYRPG